MITCEQVRRWATRAAATLALSCSLATVSAASDRLAEASRAFEQAALRVNDRAPSEPVKWNQPIFLAIADSDRMRSLAPEIEAAVRHQAAIAGVPVSRVSADDPRGNFLVRQADPNGRAACRAGISSRAGHIVRVDVEIWLGSRTSPSRCINHEVMHGFGFRSHAHDAHSILSYRQTAQTHLSEVDRILLQTLYDPRLRAGMQVPAAAAMACAILAEKLRVSSREAAAFCSDTRAPVNRQLAVSGARERDGNQQ